MKPPVHIGPIAEGALTVGDTVESRVDYERRSRVAPNHTMTHVLNHALRRVLGEDVAQKGSLVDDAKARFDFSHGAAMTAGGGVPYNRPPVAPRRAIRPAGARNSGGR